ncbi:hypothetical protein J2798_003060 [Herbaspirillum seropedicae]|nr:hypothetical protein [Herbaspirillum seropedicae]
MLDERIHNGLRIFPGGLYQHHVASMALHQGSNLAVGASKQQIAFPVTWYRTIFHSGRPFSDRYCITDLAAVVRFLSVMGRDRRITRVRPRCSVSFFFSAPRAWMNKVL